eukprot:gb/GECH01008678.1/.p1 GENE.gb/GECH01008678.1/~~gb/GECH01008678.1/.p1  ORF type:complete len:818 (+),score=139.18 gb/GECH01008678.1/:1-2454(+)
MSASESNVQTRKQFEYGYERPTQNTMRRQKVTTSFTTFSDIPPVKLASFLSEEERQQHERQQRQGFNVTRKGSSKISHRDFPRSGRRSPSTRFFTRPQSSTSRVNASYSSVGNERIAGDFDSMIIGSKVESSSSNENTPRLKRPASSLAIVSKKNQKFSHNDKKRHLDNPSTKRSRRRNTHSFHHKRQRQQKNPKRSSSPQLAIQAKGGDSKKIPDSIPSSKPNPGDANQAPDSGRMQVKVKRKGKRRKKRKSSKLREMNRPPSLMVGNHSSEAETEGDQPRTPEPPRPNSAPLYRSSNNLTPTFSRSPSPIMKRPQSSLRRSPLDEAEVPTPSFVKSGDSPSWNVFAHADLSTDEGEKGPTIRISSSVSDNNLTREIRLLLNELNQSSLVLRQRAYKKLYDRAKFSTDFKDAVRESGGLSMLAKRFTMLQRNSFNLTKGYPTSNSVDLSQRVMAPRFSEVKPLFSLIGRLCQDSPKNRSMIRKENVIVKIVELLGFPDIFGEYFEKSMRQIFQGDPENQIEFCQLGGIDKVVHCLNSAVEDQEIVVLVSSVTTTIKDSEECIEFFSEKHGLSVMVDVFRRGFGVGCEMCGVCLAILARRYPELKDALIPLNAMSIYIRFLNTNPTEQIIKATSDICEEHEPSQNDFRDFGGFKALFRCLDSDALAKNRSIRTRVLVALTVICRNNTSNLDFIAESRGIRRIVKFIQLEPLETSATLTLSVLCEGHERNQHEARTVIPFMLQRLQGIRYSNTNDVASMVMNFCICLRIICQWNPSNLEYARRMSQEDELRKVCNSFAHNHSVYRHFEKLLELLFYQI